jgi:transcription-repair coupling factor (superfamily II helicase)
LAILLELRPRRLLTSGSLNFRVTDRIGAIAVRLIELAGKSDGRRLLYIAASAARAKQLSRVLQELARELGAVHFPPWDCLPYDRTLPSRGAMGKRIGVLHQLAHKLEELALRRGSACCSRCSKRSGGSFRG